MRLNGGFKFAIASQNGPPPFAHPQGLALIFSLEMDTTLLLDDFKV